MRTSVPKKPIIYKDYQYIMDYSPPHRPQPRIQLYLSIKKANRTWGSVEGNYQSDCQGGLQINQKCYTSFSKTPFSKAAGL